MYNDVMDMYILLRKIMQHFTWLRGFVFSLFFLTVLMQPAFAQLPLSGSVPERTLYGVVYDGDSNDPLDGAEVRIYSANGMLARLSEGQNPVNTPTDGSFRFKVTPGTYRIEVEKSGYIRSIFGGVDVNYGNTKQEFTPKVGEYFYVSSPEVKIDIPMQKSVDAQKAYTEETKVLFVTPDGTLSETCTVPPLITDITPLPQSILGSMVPTITFRVLRGDPSIEGVDKACMKLFVNGEDVTSQMEVTGAKEEYNVSYTPKQILNGETKVRIEACDLNPDPNKAIKEFSFFNISPYKPSADQSLDDQLRKLNQLVATGPIDGSLMLFLAGTLMGSAITFVYHRKVLKKSEK